ncbi:MAG: hypothetical protein V3T31_00310 [candidate division Zixibacteria bacterium]
MALEKTKLMLSRLGCIVGPAALIVGLMMSTMPDATAEDSIAQPTKEKTWSEEREFQASFTAEGMQHAVDLWYDALLKEDYDLAESYEKMIGNIIGEDLVVSEMAVLNLPTVTDDSKDGIPRNTPKRQEAQEHLQDKQRLAIKLKQAPDYAEKYRLMGGYINKLRKELKMPKLKFADYRQLKRLQP